MRSLRERSRLAAMRETQRVALDLFLEHGFDAVTVDDIAASVGMSASTIYRHFGTKEQIVLWDEYDAEIEKALGRLLGRLPPLIAIRDAFTEAFAERPGADDGGELRRIGYIYRTEQLHAAAVEADFRNREELTAALRLVLSQPNRDAAPILAGAALLALDVALDEWQRADGARPIADHILSAFDHLAHLSDLR